MYQDDPSDLQEAIRRYVWQKQQRPYHFGEREVDDLAQVTGESHEAVEEAFFGLAGDLWAGDVHIRHGGEEPIYHPGSPPREWTTVSFDREWMWRRGTLPESRP